MVIMQENDRLEAVFVYGTLKNEYSNHGVLEVGLSDTSYLGEFETNPKYGLLDLGPYPAMVYGKHRVKGEVYLVSSRILENLDYLEGVAQGLFSRRRIPITPTHPISHSPDDAIINAWAYTYNGIAKQGTVLLEEW